MRDWLLFILLVYGWAELGRAVLKLEYVNPFALGVIWLIGLGWMVGVATGTIRGEKYLLKVMLIFVAIPTLLIWTIKIFEYIS